MPAADCRSQKQRRMQQSVLRKTRGTFYNSNCLLSVLYSSFLLVQAKVSLPYAYSTKSNASVVHRMPITTAMELTVLASS